MSTPEPAQKQTRSDAARAAAPAVAPQTQAGATAGQVAANAQAGDAATTRMVADGEANHDTKWMQFAHGVTDGAQIIAEVIRLSIFNPFTGTMSGNLEIGKALYYAQLVAPIQALQMISLHGANRGSNPVHVTMNLYHKTFELTAPQLSIAGFHTGTATGKTADLIGLTAHAGAGGYKVTFSAAHLHDVTFIKNGQQLYASEVAMNGVTATEAGNEAHLNFAEAHVHGVQYPNAAPVSFDLAGGTSLDAVWSHQAPTAKAAPAATGPLPSLNVLPPGSHVAVVLTGVQAAANIAGANTTGSGGFQQLRIALVKDGADLASITVTGFHAGGGAAAAGASIDKLVLTGAPPLVESLLANQQVANDPHVRAAMQLVTQLGIKPSVNGAVTFDHVGLQHGTGGDQATGNFASTLTLPGVGKLDVAMSKFAIGTADGASGGFERFDTTLTSEAGKELGHVTIEGGSAKNVDAKTRTGELHKFHARGDVAGIVKAGDAIIKQLPLTVRSGFQLIRALGIQGDVDGTLTAKSTAGGTEMSGSFDAHLQAGDAGGVAIHVADFHGTEANAAGATFRDFTAKLTGPKGHVAATVHMVNGAFVQRGTQGAATNAFKAGKIDAQGSSTDVVAMMAAIDKGSPDLPAPVKVAFGLVRSYYVQGGGSLAMTGVDVTQADTGAATAHIAQTNAAFKLATGESISASVSGLKSDVAAKGSDINFTKFSATLDAPAGGGHATITLDRGGAHVGAAPAKAGAAPDFSMHSHQAQFDGAAQDIAKLLTGIRTHLGTLPPPIAQAFDVVNRYAVAQTKNSIDTSVSATDLAVGEAHGQETSHGTVSARVAMAGDVVSVAVHDFIGAGTDVKFGSLDLNVAGPDGQNAATLHAGSTHLDKTGAVTVAEVTATGDGARLRTAVDALGSRVPPSVSRALAAIGPSRVNAAISSISVAPTAAGGLVTDAAVMKVSAAIRVSAGDTVYASPNAQLAIYGAHVTLGANQKPQEVDASRMEVSGNFSSLGAGRDLVGDAKLHTGSAKIKFDAAGNVHSVETSQLQVAGDVTSTTKPGAQPAPTVAPTRSQQLASHDAMAAEAEQVASSVKTADIHASTPIQAGRYGGGIIHVDVPAGATIETSVQIRDYALTNGTRVQMQPTLERFFVGVKGVDLETSGTRGVMELRGAGLMPDLNLTKYVVGNKSLSLDVGTMVREIMDHMRQSLETAKQGAPQQDSAPQRDDDGLKKKHASWQRDAAKHTTGKQRDKDAATEPRSTNIADLATLGIQPLATHGGGSIEIASRDGQIDGHLTGQIANGQMRMAASDAHAHIAGQTVAAKGVDTGAVAMSTTGDQTAVKLTGFSIEQLRWIGQ